MNICKHCGSENTVKVGFTKHGTQKIKCKDCSKVSILTIRIGDLSLLICEGCGQRGCSYWRPKKLCKSCYNRMKREIKSLETELMKLAIANSIKLPISWDWQKFAKELYLDGMTLDNHRDCVIKLMKVYSLV